MSLLALALLPCETLAQTGLRGAQPPDPRAITVDPRFIERENPFQPMPLEPSTGAAPLTEPSAAPVAGSGQTSRRPPSRASRPVQGQISGRAQRPVRPLVRQVSGIPVVPPAPSAIGLRPTSSTRIVAPAPDGLQEAPPRRAPRLEEDPWAPLGLRLGSFVVTPSVTQSVGYDSNPSRAPRGAKGSVVSRTEGEVGVRSEWLTHSFTGNLRAGYSAFPDQRDANRPDASGLATLRLNVTRDTDIDIDGRLSLDTQRPGSPNLGAVTRDRPLVFGYGGAVGVTQRYNRLSFNLRGSVDRTTYQNAQDSLGNVIIQSDRDVTQLGLRARAGYELTPGLVPFVEVSTDRRGFDSRVDVNGFRRDSTGVGARVGTTLELTRLITGEASIGYQMRDFEDPRLKDLRGLVGEAALIWTPTPLTTVSLRGATDLADTTVPGVSGSINRRVGVEVAHALRRNWTLTAFANLARSDFDGIRLVEDTYQLGLRSEYKLTRTLAIRASFTHERLKSTTPGADYTANLFLLGLRLQL